MSSRLINNKLRIYLATDKDCHRKFYWFELKENDLYWGSSAQTKEAFCTIHEKSENSFSIQTPKDFKELDLSRTKYSYHESGQFHLKRLEKGKYQGTKIIGLWDQKENILEPVRILSLITKPFFEYPIEQKKLTRKKDAAQSILLEGESGNNRLFMEFFIGKPGNYTRPASLYDFGVDNQRYIFKKLSNELTLMTRFTKLANLEAWHPDKEIIFLEENKA